MESYYGTGHQPNSNAIQGATKTNIPQGTSVSLDNSYKSNKVSQDKGRKSNLRYEEWEVVD